MPVIAPFTALSTSESAKTMLGDFPPSSSVMRFTVSAALLMISWPTAVEPVNAILSMPGCCTIALPTEPGPVTILITPGGTPASIANFPNRNVVNDVWLAGFQTIVFPQASAGPTFQEASSSGKFHGTINPTTPTG